MYLVVALCELQSVLAAGLPDFKTKYPNLGNFLEGLRMENVGTFYGHYLGTYI
jgi:hypothetical protein